MLGALYTPQSVLTFASANEYGTRQRSAAFPKQAVSPATGARTRSGSMTKARPGSLWLLVPHTMKQIRADSSRLCPSPDVPEVR